MNTAHRVGGPKARGFELILGITIRDIGYPEGAIRTGILLVGVAEDHLPGQTLDLISVGEARLKPLAKCNS